MAGEITARALSGETLDALVWRVTGGGSAGVVAALEANPGLADLGAVLPVGHPVRLPATPPPAPAAAMIQLWD